jgi:hypothetical protein
MSRVRTCLAEIEPVTSGKDASAPLPAEAEATGLLPGYGKCQAYIADVQSAFRSGS